MSALEKFPAGQRLAIGRLAASKRMPYFTTGVSSLVVVDAPGRGTLGVDMQNRLYVDYEAIATLTAESLSTILLHEYMHRLFRHGERFTAMVAGGAATDTAEDRDLFNIAADAEINCNLRDAGCVFPNAHGGGTFGDGGGGVFPEQFGCQPHRRAEEYFDALKRNPPPQSSKPQPKAGWGKGCGSGSGGIPGPEELKVQTDAGRDAVEQALQQKADAQAIQGAVQTSTGRRAGAVPQGLARFAEACLEPAKVRWEQKLARSVRSAVTFQAGQGDFTWTRRARGQAALESMFGEECPVMPGEHAPRVEVAFAVDTSGSIGEPELRTIVREATGVLKNMGGAKITVLACDATVHTVARVRRPGDIRKGLKGGGGTLFQPVFDALQRVRPRPNVLIYATDGYAFDTGALRQPVGVTVIWLIVAGGQNSVPWGEVIEVA